MAGRNIAEILRPQPDKPTVITTKPAKAQDGAARSPFGEAPNITSFITRKGQQIGRSINDTKGCCLPANGESRSPLQNMAAKAGGKSLATAVRLEEARLTSLLTGSEQR